MECTLLIDQTDCAIYFRSFLEITKQREMHRLEDRLNTVESSRVLTTGQAVLEWKIPEMQSAGE